MSETAKKARAAMKAKASRLAASDPKMKVDSSSWSPAEPLDTDAKTGARPLVKRLYKKGGKVLGKCEGGATMKRADRKARKSGGRTEAEKREKRYLTPDNLINRDVRMANDAREGKKHVGAFGKGGKTNRAKRAAYEGNLGEIALNSMPFRGAHARELGLDPVEVARAATKAGDAGNLWGKSRKIKNTDDDSGMKKGGRTGKFGGGTMGDNPIAEQGRMMGKAAGMAYKKGGSAKKREHHADGEMVGDAKTIEELIKKYPAPTKTNPPKAPAKPIRRPMTLDEERAANAAAFDKEQQEYQRSLPQNQKSGGKVSHMEWEHSKADLKQDKKLAKKHGMSMEKWEKSKLDEKHDKQQSTEGLKKGGRTARYAGGGVFSGDSKSKIPGATGGRSAHAKGGKAGKSKTNINIIIGAGGMGQKPELGDGMMPNAPVGAPPRPLPVPPPAAMPQGGAPMPMPPMGGGMGGGDAGGPPMPPMAMARKSGGRTIHVINHGAGGGKGRLEKIKAYGLKPAR